MIGGVAYEVMLELALRNYVLINLLMLHKLTQYRMFVIISLNSLVINVYTSQ